MRVYLTKTLSLSHFRPGGEDASSFSLMRRPGSEKAELISNTELDFESARKKYDVIVRAASPPLRSDVHVEIVVTDVNDNAPRLQDFQVRTMGAV